MEFENNEFSDISYQLTGACFEVNRLMGAGLLEKCYQQALEIELRMRGIPFEREKRIEVFYKGIKLDLDYIADFIVDGRVIMELKAVSALDKNHEAQILNYMHLTGCRFGMLVNFGKRGAEIQRYVL